MERLESYSSAREAEGCGNPDCQECGVTEEDFEDMPTLEEMISSAVASGIEQYEKKRLAAEKKASRPKKPTPVSPETGEAILK